MSRLRRFWQKIKGTLSNRSQDTQVFMRDLQKKVYEKFVDNLAVVIVAAIIAALLYFSGADKIVQFWNSFKDQEQNYVERKITGRVYDTETDLSLSDVRVGLVGDTTHVYTNSEGIFKLKFDIHKDSSCVRLSLFLPGYELSETLRDIPLTEEKAAEVQDFTLTPLALTD